MSWWSADTAPPGGRSVNETNATCLGPVFAAIRHIVDFGSTLPVHAYRKMDDGTRTTAPMPLLIRNQEELGYPGIVTWIGQAFYALAVHGNAVGWVVEVDGLGNPSDVRWLGRQDWQWNAADKKWLVYGQPVPNAQILHIPWLVPSGSVLGMSPIEHAAATISAGLSAQEYADVKRGGGIPPTVLKNTQLQLDPEQSAQVRERAIAAFTSGKPFVTGKDWDLSLTTIPPNHAQFIETLQMTANQVAAMYGLDPREVGGSATESMTYVNDEARTLNRAANMRPYIERFEAAINRVLPERQFIKLNVDATIRSDIKTRTEILGLQIADGRLSVNEARAIEDRPSVDGGDRHNFLTPATPPRSVPSSQGETP